MSFTPSGGIAKVLVVGDVATGKTSCIRRYTRNTFSNDYQTTIGVDFNLKKVNVDGTDLNVQLWDIAGQERFSGLSRIFYTHAVAAIVVYDLFNRQSFTSAASWKKDIDAKVFLKSGASIPVVLLGNKHDLITEENKAKISDQEIEDFVAEHKFYAHYKCSAKSAHNIIEACDDLVSKIVANNVIEAEAAREEEPEEDTPTKVEISSHSNEDSGGCC